MVVQAAQPNTHSHRTQRQAQRHTYQLRRSSLRISRLCAWRGTHPAVSWMQCALAPLGPALSEHDHPCVCAACAAILFLKGSAIAFFLRDDDRGAREERDRAVGLADDAEALLA